MFAVRIEFTYNGERLHEFVGPFDRYFAELVCVSFGEMPWRYGLTDVWVERARIVPFEEAE